MNRESILADIRKFIEENDATHRAAPASDVNLFDDGYFDSMRVVNLVLFVEQKFDCTLDYDDISEENLSTIDQIVGMIDRKLQQIGAKS